MPITDPPPNHHASGNRKTPLSNGRFWGILVASLVAFIFLLGFIAEVVHG